MDTQNVVRRAGATLAVAAAGLLAACGGDPNGVLPDPGEREYEDPAQEEVDAHQGDPLPGEELPDDEYPEPDYYDPREDDPDYYPEP